VSTSPAHPFLTPRRLVVIISLAAAGLLAAAMLTLFAAPALANTSCGTVNGVHISAHGVSCATAKTVYRDDVNGHKPHGWVCSASLRQCSKGHLGSGESVFWTASQGQGQGQGQGQQQQGPDQR